MFPLSDSTPRTRTPIINYLLIAVNVVVFIAMLSAPDVDAFIIKHGFVPSKFNFLDPSSYISILTSLFIHGGFGHIISNMWFLHIFGDNVEDEIGHLPYLGFYLVGGFAAAFVQYFFTAESTIPMVGASGAVSAVAGAYYVFFKDSTVKTLITMIFIWTVVELPATFVLGFWFISQIFAGLGSLAALDVNQGGIAFLAHVGGFIFGYIIAKMMPKVSPESV